MKLKHLFTLAFTSVIILLSGCTSGNNIDIDNIDTGDTMGDNYILVGSVAGASLALERNRYNTRLITLVFPTFTNHQSTYLRILEGQNVRMRCIGDMQIGPAALANMTDEFGNSVTEARLQKFARVDSAQQSNIEITSMHSRGASEYHGNGCAIHQRSLRPHIEIHEGATLTMERVGLTTNTNLNGYGGIYLHENAHVMMNGGSLNNITFHMWPGGRRAVVRMHSRSAFTSRGTRELNISHPFYQAVDPSTNILMHVNRTQASDANAHILPWANNNSDSR